VTSGFAPPALLLFLLAGRGREGVKLLIFFAKSNPTPTLPCKQGGGRLEASREYFEASREYFEAIRGGSASR
jgi:hypothetical protein